MTTPRVAVDRTAVWMLLSMPVHSIVTCGKKRGSPSPYIWRISEAHSSADLPACTSYVMTPGQTAFAIARREALTSVISSVDFDISVTVAQQTNAAAYSSRCTSVLRGDETNRPGTADEHRGSKVHANPPEGIDHDREGLQ